MAKFQDAGNFNAFGNALLFVSMTTSSETGRLIRGPKMSQEVGDVDVSSVARELHVCGERRG